MLHMNNETLDDNQFVFISTLFCAIVALMLISSLADKNTLQHISPDCSPAKRSYLMHVTLNSHPKRIEENSSVIHELWIDQH